MTKARHVLPWERGVRCCRPTKIRGLASPSLCLEYHCMLCAEDRFKGTGWTFQPPSADAMLSCVDRALEIRCNDLHAWL